MADAFKSGGSVQTDVTKAGAGPLGLMAQPDGSLAPVMSLPMAKTVAVPANTAFDARNYGEVKFQFASGSVSVTASLDDANLPYVAESVFDASYALQASASAPGKWIAGGGQWLKFSAPVTVIGRN